MKAILSILTVVILSAFTSKMGAQPNLQWQKNFGGSGADNAYSIKSTTDGGYIVAGSSSSTDGDGTGNHGDLDYLVIKLDASGNIQWKRSYGGTGADIANTILQTADGGYLVGGNSNFGAYSSQAWIIKLDDAGTIVWSKTFLGLEGKGTEGGPGDIYPNYFNSIIQTSDGGYLMGRQLVSPESTWENQAVLDKLTSEGNEVWSTLIAVSETPKISALVETADRYAGTLSGDIMTGMADVTYSYYPSNGGQDIVVFKTNFSGQINWVYNYGGTLDDIPTSIEKTTDGGYIVTGVTNSSDINFEGSGNHGGNDLFLLKLDSNGIASWAKCYGGTQSDNGASVKEDNDGGLIVSGYSASTDGQISDHSIGEQTDYWVMKADKKGNFLWGRSYGGTANDEASSLDKGVDGSLIVAGSSLSTDAGFDSKGASDYWILKLKECNNTVPAPWAPNLQRFCRNTHATVANLVATGTSLKWYKNAQDVAALSPSTPLTTRPYFVSQTSNEGCESIRKRVQVAILPCPFGQHINDPEGKNEFSVTEAIIYPNPANGLATVRITSPDNTNDAVVQITDVLGKVVRVETIVNNHGLLQKTINVSMLTDPMYFINYRIGMETGNLKLLLHK